MEFVIELFLVPICQSYIRNPCFPHVLTHIISSTHTSMRNGKTSLKVSEGIELRLPDTAFADDLFVIIDQQRPYLRKWLSWVDETQAVEHTQDFLRTSRMFNKGGQRLTTFIFERETIVGSIGLVKIDKDHQYAEIGYWLRQDYQGKGIVTKACRRIVDYAFRHFKLNRLEIRVASPNIKSQAIPLRLGFTHEATLRQALYVHDIFYDLELFSLLRSEWKNRKE